MAHVTTATVHIHAKDAGIQAVVNDLVIVADGIVAVRPVEKPVRG